VVGIFTSRNWHFSGKKRRAGWGESYFYLCCRRLQKAADNIFFFLLFSGLTAQVFFGAVDSFSASQKAFVGFKATCGMGGESYFYLCCRRLQKAADNIFFFLLFSGLVDRLRINTEAPNFLI